MTEKGLGQNVNWKSRVRNSMYTMLESRGLGPESGEKKLRKDKE